MNEMTCPQVEEVATEYALGILPPAEARPVSAHILHCPDCRRDIEQIRQIGDQLLDLVPDAEPPLGFDQRVLSALAPPLASAPRHAQGGRPRLTKVRVLVAAAAAVVLAVVGATAASLSSRHHYPHPVELTSVLRQGGRDVGSVYVGGNPPWVTMTVRNLSITGPVFCQLISSDGTITTVGSFQLVDGSGSWGAPDPTGVDHLTGAQVVAAGHLLARGTFSGS